MTRRFLPGVGESISSGMVVGSLRFPRLEGAGFLDNRRWGSVHRLSTKRTITELRKNATVGRRKSVVESRFFARGTPCEKKPPIHFSAGFPIRSPFCHENSSENDLGRARLQ